MRPWSNCARPRISSRPWRRSVTAGRRPLTAGAATTGAPSHSNKPPSPGVRPTSRAGGPFPGRVSPVLLAAPVRPPLARRTMETWHRWSGARCVTGAVGRADAVRLTAQLRVAIGEVRRAVVVLADRVRDAHRARVWVPLAYSGWVEYAQAELGISRVQEYRPFIFLAQAEILAATRMLIRQLIAMTITADHIRTTIGAAHLMSTPRTSTISASPSASWTTTTTSPAA